MVNSCTIPSWSGCARGHLVLFGSRHNLELERNASMHAQVGYAAEALPMETFVSNCRPLQWAKCKECGYLSAYIHVAGSIRSNRVIEVLSKLVSVHGAPAYLRSDNGSEFVSRAVLRWLSQSNINTACIDPGKPWQNGSNESFNGKFRDECLSMQWFKNRIDAKILIEEFRRQFNEVRPHSSLEQLTPAEFKRTISTISQQLPFLKGKLVRRKPAGRYVIRNLQSPAECGYLTAYVVSRRGVTTIIQKRADRAVSHQASQDTPCHQGRQPQSR
jgi:hypothetical protein